MKKKYDWRKDTFVRSDYWKMETIALKQRRAIDQVSNLVDDINQEILKRKEAMLKNS